MYGSGAGTGRGVIHQAAGPIRPALPRARAAYIGAAVGTVAAGTAVQPVGTPTTRRSGAAPWAFVWSGALKPGKKRFAEPDNTFHEFMWKILLTLSVLVDDFDHIESSVRGSYPTLHVAEWDIVIILPQRFTPQYLQKYLCEIF